MRRCLACNAFSGDAARRLVEVAWMEAGQAAAVTRATRAAGEPRLLRRVLIVEPDADAAQRLADAARAVAEVRRRFEFSDARGELLAGPYDLLVTNLRLGAYNGIHLVYLAAANDHPARCIVYTDVRDEHLAHEVQHAGAFYETRECLEIALGAYLGGTLPARDRRWAETVDRRRARRGGRRCWDQRGGRAR